MRLLLPVLVIALLQVCYAPPVSQTNKHEATSENETDGLQDYMEYHRYLREVVNALESDPEFRQKLEKANEEDIKSGKIAHELEFVSHNVRTRLDEIKRTELERLRQLMEKKRQLQESNEIDDPMHHHLDHTNPHTFEIEDLKKLIAKTSEDLAEADKKRREEFKEYEMQKELEKQEKLKNATEEERTKLEKEFKEQEEKHKKHEPLHEPGHKAQLEEVWQEQDNMQQEFNPKTFFMLHDLDSNGLWDQEEVKALFIKELDKMYQAGAPEDDMRERVEEMERMRETVFREVDTNRDGFIDYDEFLAQTKRNDFQQDHGWQGLDQQKPYTDEELAEYIRQHQAYQAAQYQAQYGYPPQPGYHPGQAPPQGYQQQPPPGYHPNQGPPPPGYHSNQQAPPVGHPNQQANQGPPPAYHPNQVPQGYQQGHVPPASVNQGSHGQTGQFYPGDVPQSPPQHINAQQVQSNNINKHANLPELNTNEIYPHQQQNIPVQNVQQQQYHQQQQNIPVQNQQPVQGNQPQNAQYQQQQQYQQPPNQPANNQQYQQNASQQQNVGNAAQQQQKPASANVPPVQQAPQVQMT